MANVTSGGPAFPVTGPHVAIGMSLRDYFAAQALMGLLAGRDDNVSIDEERVAGYVYSLADAMLKAREE